MPQSEPDVRPLGFIAIGFALVSIVLVPTFFFIPYAYLAAVPALILGFAARGVNDTRAMGNAAVVIAGAALVWATCAVLSWF